MKHFKSFQFLLSVSLSIVLTIVISALVVEAMSKLTNDELVVDGKATFNAIQTSDKQVIITGGITGGNVGIGTTASAYKLDVYGPIRASSTVDAIFRLDRFGATYPTTFKLGTDSALVINSGNSDVLTLKNGNVAVSGDVTAPGIGGVQSSVCRKDGTNCPASAALTAGTGISISGTTITNTKAVTTVPIYLCPAYQSYSCSTKCTGNISADSTCAYSGGSGCAYGYTKTCPLYGYLMP